MASLSNALTAQRARLGRVLLAASASSLMTCVVALPMAYQAHAARAELSVTQPVTTAPRTDPNSKVPRLPPVEVLGTTTIATTETEPPTEFAESPTTSQKKPRPTTTTRPRSPRATSPDASKTTFFEGSSTSTPAPTTPQTSIPGTSTTEVRITPGGIFWSTTPSLLPSFTLQSAEIVANTESIYVFLDAGIEDGIVRVQFFLDDKPKATDMLSPWELLGGASLDPADLTVGQHTVRAEVTFTDGRLLTREAAFSILSS